MKKTICCMLSVVLALGALTLFAGCGEQEVTDEATRAEVLAALDEAEFPAFEGNMEVKAVNRRFREFIEDKEVVSSEEKNKSATQTIALSAYEEDGLVYGDAFGSIEYGSEGYDLTEEEEEGSYAIAFLRGDAVYTAEEPWGALEPGDFDGILGGIPLLTKYDGTVPTIGADGTDTEYEGTMPTIGDTGTYADFGLFADSKVYSSGGGYRVEYDVMAALGKVFDEIAQAEEYYIEHPNCTVGELFAAAGIGGYDAVAFPVGDMGGIPAREVFGNPYTLSSTLRTAKKDPAAFLLDRLFGFPVVGSNKGSMRFLVSLSLDGGHALTGISCTLAIAMSSITYLYPSAYDYGQDRSEVTLDLKMEFRPLSEKPTLTDLAGMNVDMGQRPEVGTYRFSPEAADSSVTLTGTAGGGALTGKLTGTVTVLQSGKVEIALTLTAEGGRTFREMQTIDGSVLASPEANWYTFFKEIEGTQYGGLTVEVAGGRCTAPSCFPLEVPMNSWTVTL